MNPNRRFFLAYLIASVQEFMQGAVIAPAGDLNKLMSFFGYLLVFPPQGSARTRWQLSERPPH